MIEAMDRQSTGDAAMAQMGFFDLSDRYASLDAKKDPQDSNSVWTFHYVSVPT